MGEAEEGEWRVENLRLPDSFRSSKMLLVG
jgi:hypothetical protein